MAERTLTELEVKILDYAEAHPSLTGLPYRISEFGWRSPAYLSRLFELVDDPVALAARPMLVKRVQRLRDGRSSARAARSFRTVGTAEQPRSAG